MVRKKMSERSNGECIGTVFMVGLFSLIANIIMPLPTGLLPVFGGFGIVLICTLIYLGVRQNPNASSGSSYPKTHIPGSPTIASQILCSNCNSPVEPDQEFCQQCGQNLKHN